MKNGFFIFSVPTSCSNHIIMELEIIYPNKASAATNYYTSCLFASSRILSVGNYDVKFYLTLTVFSLKYCAL